METASKSSTKGLCLFILVMLLSCHIAAENEYRIEYLEVVGPEQGTLNQQVSLLCTVSPSNSFVWWTFNGKNMSGNTRVSFNKSVVDSTVVLSLNIKKVAIADAGNYTCHGVLPENREIQDEKSYSLNVVLDAVVTGKRDARVEHGKNGVLECNMSGYPLEDIDWQIEKAGLLEILLVNVKTEKRNATHVTTKVVFPNVDSRDNGTYSCNARGHNGHVKELVHFIVLAKPEVKIDLVKAVGSHVLFVNWTVNDGNSPIEQFYLRTKEAGTDKWVHYPERIGGGNTSYLIKNLKNNTGYDVHVDAQNAYGRTGDMYATTVVTLNTDPTFVPTVENVGATSTSLSLSWSQPPVEVRDYIQYYQIMIQSNTTTQETIHPASSSNMHLFTSLSPYTMYRIRISACCEYTRKCGEWSEEANGTTLDGISEPPENVSVTCRFDNISHASFVSISWQPPRNPNGQIMHYNVILSGVASYRNHKGLLERTTFGPKIKTVSPTATTAKFEVVPPNTNYTVNVSVVTKSRQSGKGGYSHCSVSPTVPGKDKLLRFNWVKVPWEDGRWLFRLSLDRLSERNGAICCYMVYMVKLKPGQRPTDLAQPEELPVSTYEEVHRDDSGGAYIAEAVDSNSLTSELLLGDGKTSSLNNSPCKYCVALQHARRAEKARVTTTTTFIPLAEIPGLYFTTSESSEVDTETTSEPDVSTVAPLQLGLSNYLSSKDIPERFRRLSRELEENPFTSEAPPVQKLAYDGVLDKNFNYTGFLEVVVYGEKGSLLPAYSNYFMAQALPPTEAEPDASALRMTVILHVLIALVVIVVILLIVLFVLHNYTKNVAEERGIEMTFTNTLMHLCRNVGGRHVPVSSSPPDLPPVPKLELATAVAERHRDSDYGFQHEFEMLPDRFPDRTTRASETRENFYKNRYPDIKAYDQTRVRLSQVDGIAGSDYINANYVVGYKERKKFICAQGPMENTVNEFWRMVWEQHLEMVLMLTNLEEYSKTKCAKYWPDKEAGEKKFGDLSVSHVHEKRFSDYIVRELKVRHVTEGSGEKDKEEERSIVQYHYLVWKDFMAPENPSGILKFIKRINEDYSLEKGPILIHCSAGVGRTGTLVALDSLLQQLREENQVAIFNTVCDLRHQRNFLVQSLKQYIFVYRALLEVSQSGDTEIKVSHLKSHVEKLRHKENGKDKSLLEEEFEKLQLLVDEKGKTWSFGILEENKGKNRNENVIPYDRNRLMLAPVPGKDHSTYINASFIEGYDNTESFIVAQDPMPNTLSDFWRMICEQCVSTLVMMSDLGDGPRKCIRYWPEPDDESTYDNIRVKYIQSESCPYYTRREFAVTNIKTDDTIITTQFQYNGWPTVEGEVPEVTRGLIELVDQTQENHSASTAEGSPGPTLVHCNWGAERSAIFVALTILVQQLKTERAVDLFTVVRKLRSQRQMMVHNLVEYELLHRAIVNYADLHHMTENGTTSPL